MSKLPFTYPLGFLLLAVVALTSCNNTKYLAEGESLYIGAKVILECDASIPREGDLRSEIDEVVTPAPNGKFLGMRPSLWFYNRIKEPKKNKGLRYFFKYKIGRPPVLESQVKPERVSKLIQNRLYNNGYFNNSVDFEVIKKSPKKTEIHYNAYLEHPYRLDTIQYVSDSSLISLQIDSVADETLLERGQPYQLKTIQAERERVNRHLKNRGYFYFGEEFVRFSGDTTLGNKRMNVFIDPSPTMPKEATQVFTLGRIAVYPNYKLGKEDNLAIDSTEHRGMYFYENHEEHLFRPKALRRSIFMKTGEKYSREKHELTLNRLMGLGAFKFVDVRFNRAADSASHKLNTSIYLTPMDKKTLRAELEMVTKSNNFIGPGITGTWTNRNTFGGAELLRIDLGGGVETQFGSGGEGGSFGDYFSYRLNLGAQLQVPRFLTPFKVRFNSKFVPKTNIKANYELINRTRYFMLHSLSTSYGYSWKPNEPITHELTPISLSYSQLATTSDAFEMLLDSNQFLANSFSERFIIGPEYKFTFNDQVKENLRNHVYYSLGGDISNPFGVLGELASVYARFTSDFRYFFKLTKSSKLATRLYAGIGLPYGHSRQLPYVKQFFAGGPNGVRAFRARTVGPGTYNAGSSSGNGGFLDQNGDLKLLFSLEYRFKIYGVFHGAVFGDAGNIWLLNANDDQPGGQFETSTFMNELSVGAGIGLRVDFSFFLLRLDVAMPLRKPYLPENNGWVPKWFKEKPVFNLAIGYPF